MLMPSNCRVSFVNFQVLFRPRSLLFRFVHLIASSSSNEHLCCKLEKNTAQGNFVINIKIFKWWSIDIFLQRLHILSRRQKAIEKREDEFWVSKMIVLPIRNSQREVDVFWSHRSSRTRLLPLLSHSINARISNENSVFSLTMESQKFFVWKIKKVFLLNQTSAAFLSSCFQ